MKKIWEFLIGLVVAVIIGAGAAACAPPPQTPVQNHDFPVTPPSGYGEKREIPTGSPTSFQVCLSEEHCVWYIEIQSRPEGLVTVYVRGPVGIVGPRCGYTKNNSYGPDVYFAEATNKASTNMVVAWPPEYCDE